MTSRAAPPGVVSVPVMSMTQEGKQVPEFFYREAIPPPEVLQPPPRQTLEQLLEPMVPGR